MTAAIVGAWRTTVTIEGVAAFLNLTTFSSDGVVLNAFPTPSPATPGSSHKLEFFTLTILDPTGKQTGSVRGSVSGARIAT